MSATPAAATITGVELSRVTRKRIVAVKSPFAESSNAHRDARALKERKKERKTAKEKERGEIGLSAPILRNFVA